MLICVIDSIGVFSLLDRIIVRRVFFIVRIVGQASSILCVMLVSLRGTVTIGCRRLASVVLRWLLFLGGPLLPALISCVILRLPLLLSVSFLPFRCHRFS